MTGSTTSGEKIKLNDLEYDSQRYTGTNYNACACQDEEKLLELSPEEEEKWRKGAVHISIATIALLAVLGVVFVVLSIATNSSAALGLAGDMALDSLTSVVVLWRFYNPDNKDAKAKERRAIYILGAMFIMFGGIILFKSVFALIVKSETTGEGILSIVSGIAAVVMTFLAGVKFAIARKLHSKSILSDAFSSAMGALISYGIVIGTLLSASCDVSNTLIDSVTGIVVAVMLAVWGVGMMFTEARKK
ncbi:transmembrane protein 163b-like [Ptychodera flava]|uniref:transmembrane protein 163b-like n=1 Tax=Ptychodera flava TaxID=63121 RepID=UPI003969D6A9